MLRDKEVGDVVVRNLCGAKHELKITKITEDVVHCGPWRFCRTSGMEIDDDCRWGPEFGRTGSVLEQEKAKGTRQVPQEQPKTE